MIIIKVKIVEFIQIIEDNSNNNQYFDTINKNEENINNSNEIK